MNFFKKKLLCADRLPIPVYCLSFTNAALQGEKRKQAGLNPYLLLFLLSVLCGCLGPLPSKEELKKIQTYTASEVYSADSVLLGRYFIENRTNARFSDISTNIINALIATEDVRFYRHEGVDTRSLLRVLIKTILLGEESSGGGSTISQQLVKNLFPREKGTFGMLRSKIREAVIALRLEDVYTKDQLLTLYLNTVSFGEEVFGIETAAERYFSIKPGEANIQQAATLVGMLKAPSLYNPRTNPENAVNRRNTVISQMAKYHFISRQAADSLKALPLALNYSKLTHESGIAPYFREMLRLNLERQLDDYNKRHNARYNLYTDGLKIYTTIHSRMQRYAEQAVKIHVAELQQAFDEHWNDSKPWDSEPEILKNALHNSPRFKSLVEQGFSPGEAKVEMQQRAPLRIFSWKPDTTETVSCMDSLMRSLLMLQTGVLAMNPATGEIKAWVGGIDYSHFKYDHVTSRRQVGSTFKPVVYAAALEKGISPCKYFPNEKKVYDAYEGWSPQNADNVYGGYYSMQGALVRSINTIAPQVLLETGIDSVIAFAESMGIATRLPAVPSLALGSADISLLEMTTAYCAFANKGYVPAPRFLLAVHDANGNTLITPDMRPLRKAMSTATAAIMTHFLQSVVDSGTASSLRSRFGFTFDIAGKTGTTQNHSDGWFIGYTPALVCGVWVGADNPRIHFRDLSLGQGSLMALPIWAYFMDSVISDKAFADMKHLRFSADARLLSQFDCPMYKEHENLWERLFGRRHRRRSMDEHQRQAAAEENQMHQKPEKLTFRERLKKAFGKQEK